MKPATSLRRARTGFTLVELMVAIALAGILLTFLAVLFTSSISNFAGLGNYAELSGQSRLAMDQVSQELRECTQVLNAQKSSTAKSLLLTNAFEGSTLKLMWDSSTRTLTSQKSNRALRVCLTGCDDWDFSLYQRTPKSGWQFYPTTNPQLCKLVNMSWRCSRSVLGRKANTENVVTAQVVIRNKK
jgi:prepilin-type N-terminal cleavage/methylation domain-containing protein